jgi:transposase
MGVNQTRVRLYAAVVNSSAVGTALRRETRAAPTATKTSYDSNDIIAAVRKSGMKPVICAHPRRNKKPRLDRKTYKKRYLVEVYFHNIKRFSVVATRYKNNARHYLSLVQLVSSLL